MEIIRGRAPVYPWGEWMDGEEHEVVYREDFFCMPAALVTTIRNKASRMKKRVAVEQNTLNTVRFQFFDQE